MDHLEWNTGIVTNTNSFFGLRVNGANDTSRYLYQISTYATTKDGYVVPFSSAAGFLDSGMGFLSLEKG